MMKKNILYLVPVLLGLFLLSCGKDETPAPEPLAIDDLIGNFTADFTYASGLPQLAYVKDNIPGSTPPSRVAGVIVDAQRRPIFYRLDIPEEDEGASFSFEKTDDTSGTLTIELEDGPELVLKIEKVRATSSSKKVTFKIDDGELKMAGQTIPLTDIDFDKEDADDVFFKEFGAIAAIPSGGIAAFTQAFNPASPYVYYHKASTTPVLNAEGNPVLDNNGNPTNTYTTDPNADAGDPPPLPATILYGFQVTFDGIFKEEK